MGEKGRMSGIAPETSAATRYEVAGGVATITLARAESRNALDGELLDSLGGDLRRATADDAVRAVVLSNDGTTFCAGADLKRVDGRQAVGRIVEVFEAILDSPKPVVGRIAGHCMGGGVGLAAACDISVAADDVRLGFTEVRVGVAPAIISVVCLPKMRRGDASELFLTGERIDARRAVEVGLLNRVVPRVELDVAVEAVLAGVLAGGPEALAASKALVRTVPTLPRGEAFEWTARLSAERFASPEAAEGMAAFRERRPAAWVPVHAAAVDA